jgi:predicted AAA+ superfamily ATPase
MNTFLKNTVKWTIDYLQNFYDQQQLKDVKDVPPYSPLSPTSQAKDTSEYCNALDWAISNRKKEDIKNIALTGPYGSGKSSIIKTYIETNTNKDLHLSRPIILLLILNEN